MAHQMTVNNAMAHTSTYNYPKPNPKIAIIGGGLSGLLTATLLERAFSEQEPQTCTPQITIFEKSRSVGRLATRYRTDEHTNKQWQWAFGAQFFTAKTDAFSAFITPWLKAGVIQPWCAHVVELTPNSEYQSPDIRKKEQWDSQHARYISTPKMTSWGRALAAELQHTTLKFKTHVAPLIQTKVATDTQTELFDDTGASLGHFDWVICTVPAAQAINLLAKSGFDKLAQIRQPQMQACYTLMLGWDSAEQLPNVLRDDSLPIWDVAYLNESILDRIFIEHHKPAHDELLPSITIHARNDWSEANVDEDIETVQTQLLAAAQQVLQWNNRTAPIQIDIHRWRYAATLTTEQPLGIAVDNSRQWIVSGDWCGQGNIESCYQMAVETIQILMNAYKN